MQFKVPQFIDIEDKVFGPLTFKQFAYLAGGAGFAYLSFRFLPVIIAIIVGPALIAFALALAFLKYNEKPFINVVQSFVRYYTRSRLYLWHKIEEKNTVPKKPIAEMASAITATPNGNRHDTMTASNLQTLSWSLDVIDPKK